MGLVEGTLTVIGTSYGSNSNTIGGVLGISCIKTGTGMDLAVQCYDTPFRSKGNTIGDWLSTSCIKTGTSMGFKGSVSHGFKGVE